MTIRQSQLRGFRAAFHRNGSSGDGFFLCTFKFGGDFKPLVAVVYCSVDDIASEDRPELTAVANPENIRERFDGPAFFAALKAAVYAVARATPETLYTRN